MRDEARAGGVEDATMLGGGLLIVFIKLFSLNCDETFCPLTGLLQSFHEYPLFLHALALLSHNPNGTLQFLHTLALFSHNPNGTLQEGPFVVLFRSWRSHQTRVQHSTCALESAEAIPGDRR